VKNRKVNSFLDTSYQCNLVFKTLVYEINLETYNLVHSSSLVWLKAKTFLTISRRYKIKFSIIVNYVDEVECEVAPLDVYKVMFGSPYL
jgi:hypothetical protein